MMESNPSQIIFQIVCSIVPPLYKKFQKKPSDLVGPIFGVIILIFILNYGYLQKQFSLNISPFEVTLFYVLLVPLATFLFCRLGQSQLSLLQVTSLVGYALYGHIFTLAISLLFFQEDDDYFFFICFIVFGGLSTLRMCLFLLWSIPKPGAGLIICSLVSVVNILFLLFGHFGYMHPTFVYAKNLRSSLN